MSSLSFLAILQASVIAMGEKTYAEAHSETTRTGRPMVVLVSADWCPACVAMKKQVIPQVTKRGLLKKVVYAVVNLDRERVLGRQLTGGGPIPQLIMFRKTTGGWKRRKLIGGQGVGTVENFIGEGIKLDESTKKSRVAKKNQLTVKK